LLIKDGQARLVRQALVHRAEGLDAPTDRFVLISGRLETVLDGPVEHGLIIHTVEQVDGGADIDRTIRQQSWAIEGDGAVPEGALARETGRSLTWDLAGQVLGDSTQTAVEIELDAQVIELLADEWMWSPELGPTARRRVVVRLGEAPVLAGPMELVVDGRVLDREGLAFTTAGDRLAFAVDENQGLFQTQARAWPEDPNRRRDTKRQGADYHLRNLTAADITVAAWMVHPISAAADRISVALDPDLAAAGWESIRPGVMRRMITVPAGEELVVPFGWIETAKDIPIE
jgi:hypothetical protein